MAYFCDSVAYNKRNHMDETVAFGDTGEWSKALIACHCVHTVEEFPGFKLCTAVKTLPAGGERLRAIVVVHNGRRVAGQQESGIEVSDGDLTRRGRQRYETNGTVVPIDKSEKKLYHTD